MRLLMPLLGLLLVAPASANDIDARTRACVAAAPAPAAILVCERRAQAAWRQRVTQLRATLEQRLDGDMLTVFRQADAAWERQRLLQGKLLDRLAASASDDIARMTIEGEKTLMIQQRADQFENLMSILTR